MSLNTAHAQGGVLIYSGERILIFHDGVEMAFDMSCNMSHFKGHKKGRIYLTTHRVIFNTKSLKDTLQSFSIPFQCMKNVELEQPVFGANYIKGKVIAEQNGNWEGDGKFKLWFNTGGAIEFGRAMLQAGKLASRNAPAQPPPYVPPTANYYQAPPPAYTAPQDPVYGFVPQQTFPTAPPSDGVYMYEAPPPYPGIAPNMAYPPPQAAGAPYPPPQANGLQNGMDAKAAEAAASGYYNPSDPHTVYMPQPYPTPTAPEYGAAPPSYNDATKKTQ